MHYHHLNNLSQITINADNHSNSRPPIITVMLLSTEQLSFTFKLTDVQKELITSSIMANSYQSAKCSLESAYTEKNTKSGAKLDHGCGL